jgi:hypothetical protein
MKVNNSADEVIGWGGSGAREKRLADAGGDLRLVH